MPELGNETRMSPKRYTDEARLSLVSEVTGRLAWHGWDGPADDMRDAAREVIELIAARAAEHIADAITAEATSRPDTELGWYAGMSCAAWLARRGGTRGAVRASVVAGDGGSGEERHG